METLVIILGAVWPLLSTGITWAVTELVNTHLFDKLGIKDSQNIIVHYVAYTVSALVTVGYLLATHHPLTDFGTILGVVSTAVLGKMGASYIHDAGTPPVNVNPGAVTENK